MLYIIDYYYYLDFLFDIITICFLSFPPCPRSQWLEIVWGKTKRQRERLMNFCVEEVGEREIERYKWYDSARVMRRWTSKNGGETGNQGKKEETDWKAEKLGQKGLVAMLQTDGKRIDSARMQVYIIDREKEKESGIERFNDTIRIDVSLGIGQKLERRKTIWLYNDCLLSLCTSWRSSSECSYSNCHTYDYILNKCLTNEVASFLHNRDSSFCG